MAASAPVLNLALVAGSPHVRGELDAGLRQAGAFEIVLHAPSLHEARRLGFGQARLAIVDLGSTGDDPSALADEGPPLLLLAGPRADIAPWWHEGASVLDADATLDQIAAAADAAAAGLVVCSPALTERLAAPRGPAPDFEPLTPREHEVLRQMSFGLGNREIAEALHISPHTAKFHVAQVIAKLKAGSRAHAVANALRAGWVDTAA